MEQALISLRSITLALVSTLGLLVTLAAEDARVSCDRQTLVVTVSDKAGPVLNLNTSNVRLDPSLPGLKCRLLPHATDRHAQCC